MYKYPLMCGGGKRWAVAFWTSKPKQREEGETELRLPARVDVRARDYAVSSRVALRGTTPRGPMGDGGFRLTCWATTGQTGGSMAEIGIVWSARRWPHHMFLFPSTFLFGLPR
jgi:hypothetical protein